MSGIMRNEVLVSSSNQWYYCYIESEIHYSVERRHLVCVVWCVLILCYLGKHNSLKQSSFQVASLSDEHSLLKKFSEFQKRGKERLFRKCARISRSAYTRLPLGSLANSYTDSWFNLCYLGKHNSLKQSSFQVASLSDEHSLLKKFSEFQKRGKERLVNLCYLGKTQPSPILFVPSCKFIGRTFAFKKFYGVFKRGNERLYRFLIQPLLFRKTQPSPNIFVPSCNFIGRTFAFKKFYGVSKEG
jgi:hypothetical protein